MTNRITCARASARCWLLPLAAGAALLACEAGAQALSDARYTQPVERYGHFALGRPHEYARLQATDTDGRSLSLDLPQDEVFEDLAPRRVTLVDGEAEQLLAVVSQRDSGARLVLFGIEDDTLVVRAQSAAIGTAMRWLNPVGVADLDGDGSAEIAAVITPHIGGTLVVYRREGETLVEVATLEGFSNHVYGSPELALSAITPAGRRMRLVVPDSTRNELRVVALENDRLVETGRCPLPAPVTDAIEFIGVGAISVPLVTGLKIVLLSQCR